MTVQSLFDLSMPAPLSYLVAILVILGLLAIFAIIVRRVAAHGPHPEGHRGGRGPRLGVVDTFSLDKDRQLVIVRRDNIEHLLMIGGTNDVVVETNIIRTLGAQTMREPPFMGSASEPAPQLIESLIPQPPVAPPQAPVATPRLRPAQTAVMPQAAPSMRATAEFEPMIPLHAPQAAQQGQAYEQDDAQDSEAPSASPYGSDVQNPQQAAHTPRQVLNQSELIALAKRLEASIPQVGSAKTEKPAAAPPIQPAMAPASMSAPLAPPSEPHPASVSLKPQIQAQMAPPIAAPAPSQPEPDAPQRPLRPSVTLQPRPSMPQPAVAPVGFMPEPQMQPAAPMPSPQPTPMAPQPRPSQEPMPSSVEPAAPKDRQAAALDENLRRLLGRKVEPRQ